MIKQIFLNLHVKDLYKAKDFYTKLGFTVNESFTSDTAACMIISDNMYVMLLTYDKFKEFTSKEISDATKTTEVLTALSVNSRDQVDTIADAAINSGGTEARPSQDHGFMYGRAFNDLDGHIWEVFWMDMASMPKE